MRMTFLCDLAGSRSSCTKRFITLRPRHILVQELQNEPLSTTVSSMSSTVPTRHGHASSICTAVVIVARFECSDMSFAAASPGARPRY